MVRLWAAACAALLLVVSCSGPDLAGARCNPDAGCYTDELTCAFDGDAGFHRCRHGDARDGGLAGGAGGGQSGGSAGGGSAGGGSAGGGSAGGGSAGGGSAGGGSAGGGGAGGGSAGGGTAGGSAGGGTAGGGAADSGFPRTLEFTTAPQSINGAQCAAIGIERRELDGGASDGGPLLVQLQANPSAGVTFYASATTCMNPVTSVSMLSGSSSATFSVRATVVGMTTISVSAPNHRPASQLLQTTPGPASVLAFAPATGPAVNRGECGTSTLEIRDSMGNPTTSLTATSITLSGTPASLNAQFYSDEVCGKPTGTVTIPASLPSVTFSFRSDAGTLTINAFSTLTAAMQMRTIQ